MTITVQMRTEISQLYVALFGRAPDGEGLGFWVSLRDQGQSLAQIANTMYATTPARAIYPSFMTNGEIIGSFYTNVLGRTADAEGLAFWTGKLNAAGATPGSVISELINTVATYKGTDAAGVTSAALFNNRVTVAQYYGEKNGNIAGASTVLATVTADAASVTTAKASIDGTVTTGSTFTLTKSVQALQGTAGNDVFIAGDEGGSATLNAGDSITGGTGTDTLKLFNAAGAINTGNFALGTISGVENVEATLSASAQTLDVSGNADVKKVSLVNGFDGVVTLKAAQTAGLAGTISTTGAAASFAFSDVTGGADTVNLELNSAVLKDGTPGTKGLTIAGVETLNIAATGTNALGDTTLAATTKLVITGAGSLSTKLISGLAKTIDGSAATGNLTIDNSAAAAAIQSIKTGSGNDIYTTKAADLTGDDVIDLGTGTDSLRFIDSATFNSTLTKATLAKVAGVEQLGVSGTGITLTVDGDYVSQTSYYVEGTTGKAVLTNIANNADITFGKTDVVANATGVNTIGMKLGANTLNVNLTGAKDGAAVVGGVVATAGDGLAVTGSATINVKSTGTDGQPNNVLDLTAADNQSVVVTGSQNLTLAAKAATGTTGFSIDGSAFTGKLTVTGTVAGDAIKGGAGNDTITGGDGTDTVTGGAGADTFVFTYGDNAGADGAAVADIITDFVVGTDKLQFSAIVDVVSGQQAAVQAAVTALAATATEAQIATAMANANTTDLGVAFAVFGGNTYVYLEKTGATATHVEADNIFIKLTGVSTLPTFAADVVA